MQYLENKWPGKVLWPLSLIYGCIIAARNKCYDHRLFKIHKVDCRIISIGNIHVGGTGKTPTVIFLAQWLKNKTFRVAVLSRGYGRKGSTPLMVSDEKKILANAGTAGDEPLLMAKRLPGVPVIVDADRVRGARLLSAEFHPEIILLDDGFQHRRLHRDVDIVTIKSKSTHSNSFLLPAGPLREPQTQLKRAHLLWRNGPLENDKILFESKPVIEAGYRITAIYNTLGEKKPAQLNGATAVAFCGLADPTSFGQTVHSLGIHVKKMLRFRDHHYYNKHDIQKIQAALLHTGADYILTTEKDWMKLAGVFRLDERWLCIAVAIEPYNLQQLDGYMANILKTTD